MPEYNPNDPLDPNRTTINNSYPDEERSGMGAIGIMVALALAVGLGLFAWSSMDGTNRVADNTAPSVTTGSSTAARSSNPTAPAPTTPAPTPPASGSTTR